MQLENQIETFFLSVGIRICNIKLLRIRRVCPYMCKKTQWHLLLDNDRHQTVTCVRNFFPQSVLLDYKITPGSTDFLLARAYFKEHCRKCTYFLL